MADGQVLLRKLPLSQEIGNPHVCHGRGLGKCWQQGRKVAVVRVHFGSRRRWSSSSSSSCWRAAAESYCGETSQDHKQFQSYSIPSENWRGKVRSKASMDIPFVNGSSKYLNHPVLPQPQVNGDQEQDPHTSADSLSSLAYSLRPKRIILVRHGQSEGNVDESAYTRIPDSKIALTEEGWNQAISCGKKMRTMIESDEGDDWKVYFYVSPYKRTLQTLRGIGLAFERERIAGVREEPRLREQDFGGNFLFVLSLHRRRQFKRRFVAGDKVGRT